MVIVLIILTIMLIGYRSRKRFDPVETYIDHIDYLDEESH